MKIARMWCITFAAILSAGLPTSGEAILVTQSFEGVITEAGGPVSVGDVWKLQFTYESDTPDSYSFPDPYLQPFIGEYVNAITDLQLTIGSLAFVGGGSGNPIFLLPDNLIDILLDEPLYQQGDNFILMRSLQSAYGLSDLVVRFDLSTPPRISSYLTSDQLPTNKINTYDFQAMGLELWWIDDGIKKSSRSFTLVPEPSVMSLIALGIAGLAVTRRRKQ